MMMKRGERKPMAPLRHPMRCLLGVACGVAATLGIADSARAGLYVIHNCNVPGAPRQPMGPWRWSASVAGGTFGFDDCATGGGFGIGAGVIPAGSASGATLETPPGIAIRYVRLWLVARLQSTGSTLFAHTASAGPGFITPAVGLFGPPGGETLSSPFVSSQLGTDTTIFYVVVSCSADKGTDCPAVDTDVLDIRGAEATLEENLAPGGSIDGGTVLTAGPQSNIKTLAYTATDRESGIARVSAIAGRTVIGTADFAADCPFAAPLACPSTRTGTIDVDTRKVADGLYPVSMRVTDAAGNEQVVQSSTAIQVANGAAAAPSQPTTAGSSGNARSTARLTASFAANHRATLTVGFGRNVIVRGRLRTQGGDPISGARLQLFDPANPAGGQAVDAGISTGADGRFSYPVRAAASRTLTIGYPSDSGELAAVARVKLRVRASATLRVSLAGIRVRYRGRVLSKPLPRRGKLVEIQGRAPGATWKTFATRRATRDGTFAGTYRLRVHRPGVRLQFRVRIPKETGYPFVAHTGRPVARIVH